MKRRKPLSRRSRLRRTSKRRAAQLQEYARLRKAWIKDHLFCEVPGCKNMTAQVHHKSGRIQDRLNDVTGWMAVCQECHDQIHRHGLRARAQGFLY